MNRRKFISSAAMASAIPIIPGFASSITSSKGKSNILLGVISNGTEENLRMVRDLGFPSCQLGLDEYTPEAARKLAGTLQKYNIIPTTLICMGPGEYKWNFIEGPSTIGLVPRALRAERVEKLKKGMEFCKAAGIPAVHAHFGFIPEDPKDVLYREFIETMKPLGEYALQKGLDIYFETGQETPVTLLRTILDIGTGNIFVNYDTANLVLYGKSNPLDGLKVIGKYVKALHAKDGLYPVNPYELGREVPIPEGEVNFKSIIAYLIKLGFSGAITIEYELGEQSRDYLLKTKSYLEDIINRN